MLTKRCKKKTLMRQKQIQMNTPGNLEEVSGLTKFESPEHIEVVACIAKCLTA